MLRNLPLFLIMLGKTQSLLIRSLNNGTELSRALSEQPPNPLKFLNIPHRFTGSSEYWINPFRTIRRSTAIYQLVITRIDLMIWQTYN